MKLPNFIIAGCAKSGTSSLYEYLCLHPDIFMSANKEPRYFVEPECRPNFMGPLDEDRYNATSVWRWTDYCNLFNDADRYKAVGEASPMYMTASSIPGNIKQQLGEVKIIIMLRNPIEVAYSAYIHQVRDGSENLSFKDALLAEKNRIDKNWAWHWRYASLGLVVPEVLAAYLKEFKRENIKIVFYDEFKKDNFGVVQDIFRFLEVEPSIALIHNRSNEGGVPRYPLLYKLITRRTFIQKVVVKLATPLLKLLRLEGAVLSITQRVTKARISVPIQVEVHNELCGVFQNTVKDISSITGVDLTHWLKKRTC